MAGLGAEAFTVLAILEARDRASEIWDRMVGTVNRFSETMGRAAETTKVSSDAIDESLLKTASGADALDVASARVDTALAKEAIATRELATAEKELLEAQTQLAAAADGDAAAEDRAAKASDAYAVAQKRAADATKVTRDAQAGQAAVSDALAGSQAKVASSTEKSGSRLSSVASTVGKLGVGMVLAGGLMVHAAGNFQDASEHLVTDAGVSQEMLGRTEAGMLGVSSATGTTAQNVVMGMYHIESSIDPAVTQTDRLKIAMTDLQVAAQGAKVGGADLDTTTKALMGAMTAYASKGYTAVQMMNALITTTGSGDMRLQDLAGSMANVTAQAASAGIGFEQVGGAIATMTAQGFTADRATQDLANTIGNLMKPTIPATQAMQGLGINVNDVSQNLGKRGLTGTLEMFTQALAAHTKNGSVFIDTLKSSQAAAANLKIAMGELPASLQNMAQGVINGTVTVKDWDKAIKGLPVGQANLGKQFLQLVKNADSFNQLLKSGKSDAQTFNAALATMMGGQTGLNTALMLSGSHMQFFNAATGQVATSLHSTSTSVENWDKIQGTFNQKMDMAKVSVENTGIAIGTALLPAVTSIANNVMKVLGPLAQWAETHQHLAAIIFGSIAGFAALVGAINLGVKAFNAVRGAGEAVGKVFMTLGRWLGLVSTAQTEAAAAATEEAAATDVATASTEANVAATEASTVATEANNVSLLTSVGMLARTAFGFVALKTAQIAQAVATRAVTAAQWLLNAAMDVNPIFLIISAVVALVAGFIYLWNHCAAFRDFWIDMWHGIQEAAMAVWHFLDHALHAIGDAFMASMRGIQRIVSDVVGWVEGHWRLILPILIGPIGIFIDLVTKYWKDIVRIFMDGVHLVESILNWFGSLPGKFADWFGRARDAVVGKLTEAVNWVAGLPGRILNAVGNLGSLLFNAGKDVVNGLITGVKAMFGDLTAVAGQLGDAVASGAKAALHIQSPSQRMADEIGRYIPMGIALGITDNLGFIRDAMHSAANVSASTARGAFSAPLASGGASGGEGGVYIDLRGSQVMSERDMDALVGKLGRALAVRIGPQAGLRVAM